MLRHARLVEQDRAFRRNAGRDQACRDLARALAKLLRVLRHGDGVKIDDAVNRLKTVLKRHPVADRPEIIAKMEIASRLDARENTVFRAVFRAVFRWGLDGRHDQVAFPWAAQLQISLRYDGSAGRGQVQADFQRRSNCAGTARSTNAIPRYTAPPAITRTAR